MSVTCRAYTQSKSPGGLVLSTVLQECLYNYCLLHVVEGEAYCGQADGCSGRQGEGAASQSEGHAHCGQDQGRGPAHQGRTRRCQGDWEQEEAAGAGPAQDSQQGAC